MKFHVGQKLKMLKDYECDEKNKIVYVVNLKDGKPYYIETDGDWGNTRDCYNISKDYKPVSGDKYWALTFYNGGWEEVKEEEFARPLPIYIDCKGWVFKENSYKHKLTNKTMTNVIEFLKNLTLSKEEKLLRKNGLKTETGYTYEAWEVVRAKLIKDNNDYIVDIAGTMRKEDKN